MKRVIILICLMGLVSTGWSVEASSPKLTLLTDCAVFADADMGSPYVELYFGLYRNQLGFIGSDTSDYRFAGVLLSVKAYDTLGNAIDSTSSYFLTKVADEAEEKTKGVQLFDVLTLGLEPGRYRLVFGAIDNVSKAEGSSEIALMVPDFQQDNLQCSDLELALKIQTVDPDNIGGLNPKLVKEDRLVIPNPFAAYKHGTDRFMYVYSELYGMRVPDAGADSRENSFTVSFIVKDTAGVTVHDFGPETFAKPGNSAVVTERLSLDSIPPGNYRLVYEATDLLSSAYTLAIKPFIIVGEADPNRFPALVESDVEAMVDIAYFYMSEAEKMQLPNLSLEGKRNFVKQFWRQHDEDPSNPENETYNEAVRRFLYANERFSTRAEVNNGWQTDRGRVYITYGPSDEVMTVDIDGRRYPYVKWTYYDLEGPQIFVFASDEAAGIGDYRLVHSTYHREKYDPTWQQILETEIAPENDWRDDRDDEWRPPPEIGK